MATIGERLLEKNLNQTTWRNQETGAEESGTFKPHESDPVKRYGNPLGLAVKDWPARNKTGAHAAAHEGRPNFLAIDFAAEVLDAKAGDPLVDLADMCFVEGATALVLALAKDKGLWKDEPGTAPTVPPPPKPDDGATERLAEIREAGAKLRATLPKEGGGAHVSRIRKFLDQVDKD